MSDFFESLRTMSGTEDAVVLWDQALDPIFVDVEFRSFEAMLSTYSGLEVYARLDRVRDGGRVQRGYYSRRLTRWSRTLNRWQPRLVALTPLDITFQPGDKMGKFWLEDTNHFCYRTDLERETNRRKGEPYLVPVKAL